MVLREPRDRQDQMELQDSQVVLDNLVLKETLAQLEPLELRVLQDLKEV